MCRVDGAAITTSRFHAAASMPPSQSRSGGRTIPPIILEKPAYGKRVFRIGFGVSAKARGLYHHQGLPVICQCCQIMV